MLILVRMANTSVLESLPVHSVRKQRTNWDFLLVLQSEVVLLTPTLAGLVRLVLKSSSVATN